MQHQKIGALFRQPFGIRSLFDLYVIMSILGFKMHKYEIIKNFIHTLDYIVFGEKGVNDEKVSPHTIPEGFP